MSDLENYQNHWWWRVRVWRSRRKAIRSWWQEHGTDVVYGTLVLFIVLWGVLWVVTS